MMSTMKKVTYYLLAVIVLLGMLHLLFSDWKQGGVYWFNLDREKNIATWLSGQLFFFSGLFCTLIYFRERQLKGMLYSYLWLGVALVFFYASLDEMTILHENMFWKESRMLSEKLGGFWVYLTQWQLVFLPILAAIAVFFYLFLVRRFKQSEPVMRLFIGAAVFASIAFFIESVRYPIKALGPWVYHLSVCIEEEAELLLSLLFMLALWRYWLNLKHKSDRPSRYSQSHIFLFFLSIGILGGFCALYLAKEQASQQRPLPSLFEKARRTGLSGVRVPSSLAISPEAVANRTIVELNPTERRALLYWIKCRLEGVSSDKALSKEILDDKEPRLLVLSVSDTQSAAKRAVGYGNGVIAALENAMENWNRLHRKKAGVRYHWIKMDSVGRMVPLRKEALSELKTLTQAVLLPQGLVLPDMPLMQQVRRAVKRGGLESLRHGVTTGIFSDFSSSNRLGLSLYRGHHDLADLRLSDTELHVRSQEASALAADYLVRHCTQTGKFNYIYYPPKDKVSRKYNMLRHAGTIYAMMQWVEKSDDTAVLQAAERAIGYMLQKVRPGKKARELCLVDDGEIKLGGNALALLALSKYSLVTGHFEYRAQMDALAQWIMNQQEESGVFRGHKQYVLPFKTSSFVSDYYPGEAIYALTYYYECSKNEAALDVAEKAARYLILERDKGVPKADHWLTMGLARLYQFRSDALYLAHAYKIGDFIMKKQRKSDSVKDWAGSFYTPPRSTPTAIRMEALIALYRLAKSLGDQARSDRLKQAIKLGLIFQLQHVAFPESVMAFPIPQRALGGVFGSMTRKSIRIDYVQHNLSVFLATDEL